MRQIRPLLRLYERPACPTDAPLLLALIEITDRDSGLGKRLAMGVTRQQGGTLVEEAPQIRGGGLQVHLRTPLLPLRSAIMAEERPRDGSNRPRFTLPPVEEIRRVL